MRPFARHGPWLFAALLLLVCLASAWAISAVAPLPARDDFNVVRWELQHLPDKWLYLTARFFGGSLSPEQENDLLGRFLVLSARIRALDRDASTGPGAPARQEEAERLRRQRQALENDVEAVIEGRLTAVLEDAGLSSSFPLFPRLRWVFPPVDFELDEPLRVLSVSPRERIELVEQRPLAPGLDLDGALLIERAAEGDRRSALVQAVAGAATYPSVVGPQPDYQQLVETVAHEWTHHYLFFQPLGSRYFSSLELQTLNETVADLAGKELAALVVQRYPLPEQVVTQLSRLLPQEPEAGVDGALRRLRLDVETLLAQGRVGDAEALMERRRQELAEQGVVFRRINQAFFAFRSVYADNPASIDPLGLKLQALRARTGSVAAFLREAADLTSGEELDRALAGLP